MAEIHELKAERRRVIEDMKMEISAVKSSYNPKIEAITRQINSLMNQKNKGIKKRINQHLRR